MATPPTDPTPPPMPEASAAPAPEAGDASIAELFVRLAQHGEAFARAEAALLRARAADRFRRVRLGVIGVIVALLLVQAAFIALVVGLVLTLSAPLGAAGSTGLVVAGAAGLAALIGWRAIASIRQATRIERDE